MHSTSKRRLKMIVVLLAASIAALGTMPYAYRFAMHMQHINYHIALLLGIFLSIVSAMANAALGTYSLYKVNFQQTLLNPILLLNFSILSAIPTGFMSYFGYAKILPFHLNLFIAVIVVITNAAIGFTAVYNFFLGVKEVLANKFSHDELLIRSMGFVIGFFISTMAYVVSTSGLSSILLLVVSDKSVALNIAYVLAIFTWLPYAALFCHSMQVTCGQFYQYLLTQPLSAQARYRNILILLITFGAGASFTEVAIEFFNPSNDIPGFLKLPFMQAVIYNILVPLAFVSSMAVSSFSLRGMLKILRSNR